MIFAYFILAVALLIEVVGAYYSITGLAAIFSGAVIPILIMGGSLELGKVTAAVWLKNNWERAGIQYKLYLLPAVAMLMFITSMGIFGFLSKAHNDQNLVSGDVQAKIAIYDEKIKTARENIEADRKQLKQMDEAVDQVMGRSSDEKGADKANAIRKSQQRDRVALAKDIEANQKLIASLNDQAAPIRAEVRKVEAEVGPIKYIAKLIYSDNPDEGILEKAVTWVIILIVLVFDPLALVLILAAQQSIRWAEEKQQEHTPDPYVADVGDRPTLEELEPEPEPEMASDQYELEQVKEPDPVEPSYLNSGKSFWDKPEGWVNVGPLVAKPEPSIDDINAELAEAVEPIEYEILEDADEEVEAPFRGKGEQPSIPLSPSYQQPDVTEEEDEAFNAISTQQYVNPNATGLDASVERPGDYLTPADQPGPVRIPEAAPARGRGVINTHLLAEADNVPPVEKATSHGFGNEFPINPNKGDTYLRVDYLPNRLFKFNGHQWLQVDKNQIDIYAYEEQYIKHLINEIEAGRYDADSLTDVEREQIKEYLERNAQ